MPDTYQYKEGDRVRYVGMNTPKLFGVEGVCVPQGPNGYATLETQDSDSLPVEWDSIGYYGVYKTNVVLVQKYSDEPTWEV